MPEKRIVRIRLKAYDHRILDESARRIADAARRAGAKVSGPVPLPTERNLFYIIRSPHVHKNAGEHFVREIHKRLIDIHNPSRRVVQVLHGISLPAGVQIEIKILNK